MEQIFDLRVQLQEQQSQNERLRKENERLRIDNDTILKFYRGKLTNEIQSLGSGVLETPPTVQGLPVDVARALNTIHEYLASVQGQSVKQ